MVCRAVITGKDILSYTLLPELPVFLSSLLRGLSALGCPWLSVSLLPPEESFCPRLEVLVVSPLRCRRFSLRVWLFDCGIEFFLLIPYKIPCHLKEFKRWYVLA